MKVELPISIAKEMYKSGNEKLFNFAKKYYFTDDLEFKPRYGDIITNDGFITILDFIDESGYVIPIIYYNVEEDRIKYRTDNDSVLHLGISNEYRFATNDEKHLFFSKIKKQLLNDK